MNNEVKNPYDTNQELIANPYIRIPNVVANSDISIGAKYLYGYIWYWTFFGEFTKTNDQVCKALNVSLNTLRKYLKELQQANFIAMIVIRKQERHIRLLVTDEFILRESDRVKGIKAKEERAKNTPSEPPQYVKDFLNAIG